MALKDVRNELDDIDNQILELFVRRMDLAGDVAQAKQEEGKAVYDPARERTMLFDITSAAPEHLKAQTTSLFSLLMSMNKAEQERIMRGEDPNAPSKTARAALKPVDEPFPSTAVVACQGVEGAYSQIAACRLFSVPSIVYFNTFDGVFRAVREGFCDFGVLPIENSTAGSVNAVYDLLAEYSFYIVRSARLKIDHNLLAKPGTTIGNVREVFSHEQAINQCSEYLEQLGAKVTVCENTAKAAEMVAKSDRTDVAALSSRSCAELYDLDILAEDVQDSGNNYTRFVVISKDPAIYPGATRSSLMLTVNHEPGALYRVLERFYALDINLLKLESRPIPDRNFEFMFYFDLECPVGSDAFSTMLDALDDVCETYTYFGSYTEIL